MACKTVDDLTLTFNGIDLNVEIVNIDLSSTFTEEDRKFVPGITDHTAIVTFNYNTGYDPELEAIFEGLEQEDQLGSLPDATLNHDEDSAI